jgi:hypothetical protein
VSKDKQFSFDLIVHIPDKMDIGHIMPRSSATRSAIAWPTYSKTISIALTAAYNDCWQLVKLASPFSVKRDSITSYLRNSAWFGASPLQSGLRHLQRQTVWSLVQATNGLLTFLVSIHFLAFVLDVYKQYPQYNLSVYSGPSVWNHSGESIMIAMFVTSQRNTLAGMKMTHKLNIALLHLINSIAFSLLTSRLTIS